jgi:Zn-dependent protease with chaperone function
MRQRRWRRALHAGALLALVLAAQAAAAQSTPTGTTGGAGTPSASAAAAPTVPASAAVPVPVPSEKAMRYYRSGNWLFVLDNLLGILLPIVLLATGLSAWLRDVAQRIARQRFLAIALYGVLLVVLLSVLELPLAWYEGFVRPHDYGLSDQTAAKFWQDAAIGLALGCGLIAATLWFPYWLLRKSPRRWWLWTGAASVPFLMLMLFVTPIWIEPLFNKFGPMQDKSLEADILHLASRAGIEGSRVYQVDKSVDTKTVNAYVTGFMGSKRIVLWDTILAKLDRPELLYVMGHEMGHYVLHHTASLVALGAALITLGLWVVHVAAGGLIARYRARWRFGALADVASLPLMMLLFSLVSLVISPAVLAFSRHVEHEADRFGLEITHDNLHCATAFVKLQQENLSNPRPDLLVKLFRADHPPLGERIDFCNEYKPWAEGKPEHYADKIQP